MQSKLKFLALPAIMLLSACSSSGGSSTPSPSADLQGVWHSECFTDEDGDRIQDQITVSGSSLQRSIVTFLSATPCEGSNFISVNSLATFTVSGEVTELFGGDAKHIDLVFSKNTLTSGAEADAALAAEGETLQSIAANQGIDDINNIPLEFYEVPEMLFSIYRVVDAEMLIGESDGFENGSTATRRHAILNTDITYTRQ